jgi:hypothetical protein
MSGLFANIGGEEKQIKTEERQIKLLKGRVALCYG